jgi:hypothetical protein
MARLGYACGGKDAKQDRGWSGVSHGLLLQETCYDLASTIYDTQQAGLLL